MTPAFEALGKRLADILREQLRSGRPPMVPEAGVVLWNAFAALSEARTWGPSGPNPIAYSEIEAWARLTRWPLQPHHIAIIRMLDRAWLEAGAETAGIQKRHRSSGTAVTPELFDRLMV